MFVLCICNVVGDFVWVVVYHYFLFKSVGFAAGAVKPEARPRYLLRLLETLLKVSEPTNRRKVTARVPGAGFTSVFAHATGDPAFQDVRPLFCPLRKIFVQLLSAATFHSRHLRCL